MLLYYYLHKKKHNCKKFLHKWYCILVAPIDSYIIYESYHIKGAISVKVGIVLHMAKTVHLLVS